MLVCSMFVINIPPTAKVTSGLEHFASNQVSGKHTQLHRLTRAFTADIYKFMAVDQDSDQN